MKHPTYSTIIIGSGISGLYAALKLANASHNVLLVTKSRLGESNSRYAQGGMTAVVGTNSSDSVQLHVADTLKAGAGLSEFNTVKFVSEQSDAVVRGLLEFGVEFDRGENGELVYTLEGAHSVNRVLKSYLFRPASQSTASWKAFLFMSINFCFPVKFSSSASR